jgi:crotonobetainyl-CoA:carnitine CoA-transferase CaiB-like acyl-CoA transferase
LGEWCATRTEDQIFEPLLAAGVPAAVVLHQTEPAGSEQEAFRGFFKTVEHPVVGHTIGYAYPAWLTAGPKARNRSHAPCIGEHNTEVLHELLGAPLEEIAELERTGVIGRAPRGPVTAW